MTNKNLGFSSVNAWSCVYSSLHFSTAENFHGQFPVRTAVEQHIKQNVSQLWKQRKKRKVSTSCVCVCGVC